MSQRISPDGRPGGVSTTPDQTKSTAAPRVMLRVESEGGQAADRTVTIDGDLLRIGSHESNDLVLDDPRVSRFHCRIFREGGAWRVTDTDSLNGTRVQNVRVAAAYLPMPECVLQVGDSIVRITEQASVALVELLDRPSFGEIYGTSVVMRRLFAILERVAQSDGNVLIEGESGTGKELVATELVRRGARARKPFVVVDCSSIAPNLIEGELFGHVRGAFTGADRDRIGAFEAAHEGTVFLDEIGEMPLAMQPRLLRALEAREVRRLGETRPRKIDVRVIAATNRRLEREVNHGRFREDLFFRLSVVTVRVPPLRDRLDDLELLVRSFLDTLEAQGSAHLFTPAVLEEMGRYDWPGNVRELRNFVERTVILREPSHAPRDGRDEEDDASDASATSSGSPNSSPPAGPPVDVEVQFKPAKDRVIAEFERAYVAALLAWADGNVSRAARKAGMDRMNLYRLIQRYGSRETRSLKD